MKGSCFVLLQKVADMGVGDFQAGFDNDIEKGFGQTPVLYPGIGADENTLRWGFIRKVYGILSVQFVLTTVVAGFVVLSTPVSQFFQANPISIIVLAFLPLICKWPFSSNIKLKSVFYEEPRVDGLIFWFWLEGPLYSPYFWQSFRIMSKWF